MHTLARNALCPNCLFADAAALCRFELTQASKTCVAGRQADEDSCEDEQDERLHPCTDAMLSASQLEVAELCAHAGVAQLQALMPAGPSRGDGERGYELTSADWDEKLYRV